jgi:pimeloyl-ACP methyl ester carboxylesterase
LEDYAKDIKKLSEELNLKKFSILASDFGGAIAYILARDYPD